ncbi:sulfatase-like hydrolase/transferase [Nonomuraea diastatica]|uniref:sulfatase-like hydrolase/transferase n=1 Tax=Nonomuraea diastatica TaxID=1848329 RepID=UPI001FE4240B|nr:sulfatase-like hydrolase/transferase [Nonomuraea diastatica]
MSGRPTPARGAERRPNIVFILIDDLGWRDLCCYGSTFYETPHLDALAAQGALFTDAYAAAPVCSPTRASLLTGRYPARVGVPQYIGGHGVGELATCRTTTGCRSTSCPSPERCGRAAIRPGMSASGTWAPGAPGRTGTVSTSTSVVATGDTRRAGSPVR